MPKLIFHSEKIADFEAFRSLCPFGAIEKTADGRVEASAACKMCRICVKKSKNGEAEFVEDEVKAEEVDLSAYRDVCVLVDQTDGEIHPVTLELIGKGRELADKAGKRLVCLMLGENVTALADELLHYPVDEIYVYDNEALRFYRAEPYTATVEAFVNTYKPSTILVGATTVGRQLAPRVAARFRTGLTADDREIAVMLKKSGKPIVPCVNKCDRVGAVPFEFYEFYELGFECEPIAVSSVHGSGSGDLLDEVIARLPEGAGEEEDDDSIKVAVIGKPNAGKSSIINRFVGGSARSFNQQTNVRLDNKYIVLDISELTGDLLTVGMFVALDYVWDKAKEDRTAEKAIFIDETWQLIGAASNRLAAEFVLEIFKIIRGYGGSAICATQDLNDFFALEDGKYGKGIINNAKTKIVLNLEDEEAQRVQDILHLSETETMAITHFERGNGLISTNNNNITVEFKASALEKELITTDRRELKEIVDRARQNVNYNTPIDAL